MESLSHFLDVLKEELNAVIMKQSSLLEKTQTATKYCVKGLKDKKKMSLNYKFDSFT